mgnify:CR=1 FL=1
MIELFKKYLSGKEIDYEVQDSSMISFTYQEVKYLFISDNSDSNYFRMILPSIAQVTPKNKEVIEESINKYNLEIKGAKSFIYENTVWISIEQFVYSRLKIDELYERCLTILQQSFKDFLKTNSK